MLRRRKTAAYILGLVLIGIGALGILFSPTASLAQAQESKSFTRPDLEEQAWGTKLVTFELPWIQNRRGLYFMHGLIGASMLTIFSGVHLLATVRQRAG